MLAGKAREQPLVVSISRGVPFPGSAQTLGTAEHDAYLLQRSSVTRGLPAYELTKQDDRFEEWVMHVENKLFSLGRGCLGVTTNITDANGPGGPLPGVSSTKHFSVA